MKHLMKNCCDAAEAIYKTELEIEENDSELTFVFHAYNSMIYCCSPGYNNIHSLGDVCEILIGTDPNRRVYYELEVNPKGDLMIAKMTYKGKKENGAPILDISFVDEPFVKASSRINGDGFTVSMTFDKKSICTGEGDVYFNAYRIETDGGESEKYLFALNPTMEGRFHVPDKYVYLRDYI